MILNAWNICGNGGRSTGMMVEIELFVCVCVFIIIIVYQSKRRSLPKCVEERGMGSFLDIQRKRLKDNVG